MHERFWRQALAAVICIVVTGYTWTQLESHPYPEDYEERLVDMYPKAFAQLRLLALDPYDLALSKLERNIQKDRDDVKHLALTVPLDLNVLKARYQKELRWQLGNPEREDLTLKLWTEMIEETRQG